MYDPVLFILVLKLLTALLCDASKIDFGFNDGHVFDRRLQIPKTKTQK